MPNPLVPRAQDLLALAVLAAAPVAQGTSLVSPPAEPLAPNILLIAMDDIGVDEIGIYGTAGSPANTPTFDSLAQKGVLFENTWTAPLCSPTRALLMTGRFGFRTGVTNNINTGFESNPLMPSEITLPEMIDAGTDGLYSSGAFGKWHLGSPVVGGILAPNVAGWPHFDGTMDNLVFPHQLPPFPRYSYYLMPNVVNGVETDVEAYATTITVNRTIEWTRQQSGPWLAYVALHAPHDPFHEPPAALHSVNLTGALPPKVEPRPYFEATVEAMDTEVGRLIDSIDPDLSRTIVIILGDNGTDPNVTVPPSHPVHAKGTMFQGGVHVPLVIAGRGIKRKGSRCAALVHSVDIFATIADLADVDLTGTLPSGTKIDSVSLAPYLEDPAQPSLRAWNYVERLLPNGLGPYSTEWRALRDERFKLIQHHGGEQLFDLSLDPFEQNNLLLAPLSPVAQRKYNWLKTTLAAVISS